MQLARSFLEEHGYRDITDVSSRQPFDFQCTKEGSTVSVEVKGTLSEGERIVLTRGEVNYHRTAFPHNALIIVSGIEFHEDGLAHGGRLTMVSPWSIDDTCLEPVSFFYDAAALVTYRAESADRIFSG